MRQNDGSCLPDSVQRLRALLMQERPELAGRVDEILSMLQPVTSADWAVAVDQIIRGLQRAGAGALVARALNNGACPSARIAAVRLGTLG